jgi:type I restriction enzyme S subunit
MQGIVPQLETAAKSDANDKRKLVLKGDFVINSRSDRKGSSGISPFDGSVSQIAIVLEPKDISPQYAHYLMRSYSFQEEFYKWGSGIVADLWSTRFSAMKQIVIPVPPLAEQDAIGEFLDKELAEVDKLIQMQRSLISLASEHLEANILHKVTGQDSMPARVHHSNLTWFPDLPEGWTSTTIRHFAQVFAGGTPDRSNRAFWEDGQIPWINSGSVNQGRIATPSAFITEAAVEGSSTRLAPKGALVIALAGQGATKGTPALMEIDAFCNQSMAAIVCDRRVDARYLYFWLRANYLNIRSMGGGDLRDGLNLEHIKSICCPIPPKSVQIKIAEELESAVLRGNRLREQLELTITKLLERRAAVISAAVTGKLKLQGDS